MATNSRPNQERSFRTFPIMPPIPPDTTRYQRSVARAIGNFHRDISNRIQGYIMFPVVTASFDAGDTSIVITFATPEKDTSYMPIMTPDWDTRIWVSSLTINGFTINTSSAPGGTGGIVKWTMIR